MYNKNLIPAERQMRELLAQLDRAEVTVLAARLDMDYTAPSPHPFHFHIQAWGDSNFRVWASNYAQTINVQYTRIPFGYGEVFSLNHSKEVAYD